MLALKQRLHDAWGDDRGLNTAELMGNAALAIAALVVIWGAAFRHSVWTSSGGSALS